MPKTNRPPIKAARTEATKALIELHKEEHENLIEKWLAERGWTEQVETTTKWTFGTDDNEGDVPQEEN